MSRPTTHNVMAKWFHWAMAAIIITAWLSAEYRQTFTAPRTPASTLALDIHMLAGISIGILILPRLYWRFRRPQPPAPRGSPMEHALANFSHVALYVFMIGMPLTGYLGTGRDANVFGLFTIPQFRDTWIFHALVVDGFGLTFEQWEKPIDFMHKNIGGKILMPLLFALHISAALFHHFIRKDDVLTRMLPTHAFKGAKATMTPDDQSDRTKRTFDGDENKKSQTAYKKTRE